MKKELIIVAAAIFMGIAAVAFYQMRIDEMEARLTSQIKDKISICAVNKGIGARQMLSGDLLKEMQVPRLFLHPKAVKWSNRSEIIGQRVLYPMQAGQMLLWSDLEERSRRSVDDSIPPGRGVVTLPVDLVGSVSGLISPGSRVDLYGVFKSIPGKLTGKKKKGLKPQMQSIEDLNSMLGQLNAFDSMLSDMNDRDFVVMPIALNLGVFAVGQSTQTGGRGSSGAGKGFSTLSFDVPPKTQALLIMAQAMAQKQDGKLICVLRSSQAGGEEATRPGQMYLSREFVKLVEQANSEIQENR